MNFVSCSLVHLSFVADEFQRLWSGLSLSWGSQHLFEFLCWCHWWLKHHQSGELGGTSGPGAFCFC